MDLQTFFDIYDKCIVVIGLDFCPPCKLLKQQISEELSQYPAIHIDLQDSDYQEFYNSIGDIHKVPYVLIKNQEHLHILGNVKIDGLKKFIIQYNL